MFHEILREEELFIDKRQTSCLEKKYEFAAKDLGSHNEL